MAGRQKPPAVVAELGRPETPSETSARKAENSRLYRQRKTVNNLVFSLLVSLALVLVIVLIVPRGTGGFADHEVDVQELAEQAGPSAGHDLVAPPVPDGWKAKQAELRNDSAEGVTYWYVGYTTDDDRYAAVVQAFTADGSPVDDDWISAQLEQQAPSGTLNTNGFDWIAYDHTDRSPDEANMLFGLQGETADTTLLVYGTADADTIRALGGAVAADAEALEAQTDQTDPDGAATTETDAPAAEGDAQ